MLQKKKREMQDKSVLFHFLSIFKEILWKYLLRENTFCKKDTFLTTKHGIAAPHLWTLKLQVLLFI